MNLPWHAHLEVHDSIHEGVVYHFGRGGWGGESKEEAERQEGWEDERREKVTFLSRRACAAEASDSGASWPASGASHRPAHTWRIFYYRLPPNGGRRRRRDEKLLCEGRDLQKAHFARGLLLQGK